MNFRLKPNKVLKGPIRRSQSPMRKTTGSFNLQNADQSKSSRATPKFTAKILIRQNLGPATTVKVFFSYMEFHLCTVVHREKNEPLFSYYAIGIMALHRLGINMPHTLAKGDVRPCDIGVNKVQRGTKTIFCRQMPSACGELPTRYRFDWWVIHTGWVTKKKIFINAFFWVFIWPKCSTNIRIFELKLQCADNIFMTI